jgi:hypothetical protein
MDFYREGVEQPKIWADHSLPFSAEVKNDWSYAAAPPYAFMESTGIISP